MEKQIAERTLMKKPIIKDDLLFHSVHGLCRVASINRAAPPTEASYSLLPIPTNRAKVRFTIPLSSLENSGFSKLISVREAHAILEYFKTGEKKDSECSHAWMLAEMLRAESFSKDPAKDARKRQRLEQSVKGLAGELAFVLKFNPKEMAEKIRKNLGTISSINPLVLTVLSNVDVD